MRDELDQDEKHKNRTDVHRLLTGLPLGNPEESVSWRRYGNLLAHVVPSRVQQSAEPEVRDFVARHGPLPLLSGDDFARDFVQLFIDQWEAGLRARRPARAPGLSRAGLHPSAAGQVQRGAMSSIRPRWRGCAGPRTPDDELLLLMNSIGGTYGRGGLSCGAGHDEDSVRQHLRAFGPTTRERSAPRATWLWTTASPVTSCELGICTCEASSDCGTRPRVGGFLLISWNALARAVRLGGDYAEACDLGEDALAYGSEYLGPEHPAWLQTAKDLSIAWRRFGELDKALETCTDVHGRYVRRYGLDHPDTLAAAMSLANVQRNNGQEQARSRARGRHRPSGIRDIYGADHPYHLDLHGNLALLLPHLRGSRPRRAKLNEQTLKDLKDSGSDADHHYYLTVATNLASDLAALGDYEAAVQLRTRHARRLKSHSGRQSSDDARLCR